LQPLPIAIIAVKRSRGTPLGRFSERRIVSANHLIFATIGPSFCIVAFFYDLRVLPVSLSSSLTFLSDNDKFIYILRHRKPCDSVFTSKNNFRSKI